MVPLLGIRWICINFIEWCLHISLPDACLLFARFWIARRLHVCWSFFRNSAAAFSLPDLCWSFQILFYGLLIWICQFMPDAGDSSGQKVKQKFNICNFFSIDFCDHTCYDLSLRCRSIKLRCRISVSCSPHIVLVGPLRSLIFCCVFQFFDGQFTSCDYHYFSSSHVTYAIEDCQKFLKQSVIDCIGTWSRVS